MTSRSEMAVPIWASAVASICPVTVPGGSPVALPGVIWSAFNALYLVTCAPDCCSTVTETFGYVVRPFLSVMNGTYVTTWLLDTESAGAYRLQVLGGRENDDRRRSRIESRR